MTALHTRLDVEVGAVDVNWLLGQLVSVVVHCRSLVAVGTAASNSSDVQVVTSPQAAPSSAALKVVPLLHASQVRSAVALPASSWPWPAGQVAQAAQVSVASMLLLALDLNCPLAQAVHVRSTVAVATALVY